jgi:hypothetical protein
MTDGKTAPELSALTAPVVDSDTLVVYRSPGPLKKTTATTFADYIKAFFSASGGSALVGFLQGGTGAVARTVQTKMRDAINAADFGVVANGTTDDGPALRLALAAGVSLGRPVALPKTTASILVSYDPASSLGGGLYAYSILVPSGTRLITNGATIKAANGITSWNRVVTFENQSNIVVEGVLRVDANAANRGTPVNEHMHGVYFYDSSDIRIPDGIDSQNAVGDNIYVGGTSNTVGTTRVWIGDVYCKTAGRKNFVSQCSRDVFIGNCLFDNISGGSAVGGAADTTECNSLDIEPDSFTGAVPNDITFGNIVTYGSGNDFTSGTTATQADAWVLRFKSLTSYITPKATVAPWVQNAITIIGEEVKISGITSTSAQISIAYAARLLIRDVEITGSNTDAMVMVANTGGNVPVVRIGTLRLTNTNAASTSTAGAGLNNDGGIVDIGDFYPVVNNTAAWNRGTSASDAGALRIGRMFAKNIGEPGFGNYGVLQSFLGGAVESYLEIGLIDYEDTRGTKLDRVVYLAGTTGSRVHILGYANRSAVELVAWEAATGYYNNGTRSTVSKGTPEAMITAGIGSSNLRVDGSNGTALYTKESGTGNTGWRPIAGYLSGSATYDAPSLLTMGTTTTTVTVTGAAVGDFASCSFGVNLAGLVASAYVSAADTVTVALFNPTVGSVDLASTTLRARVSKV